MVWFRGSWFAQDRVFADLLLREARSLPGDLELGPGKVVDVFDADRVWAGFQENVAVVGDGFVAVSLHDLAVADVATAFCVSGADGQADAKTVFLDEFMVCVGRASQRADSSIRPVVFRSRLHPVFG